MGEGGGALWEDTPLKASALDEGGQKKFIEQGFPIPYHSKISLFFALFFHVPPLYVLPQNHTQVEGLNFKGLFQKKPKQEGGEGGGWGHGISKGIEERVCWSRKNHMKKITFYGYLISRFGNCKAIHEYLISLFL